MGHKDGNGRVDREEMLAALTAEAISHCSNPNPNPNPDPDRNPNPDPDPDPNQGVPGIADEMDSLWEIFDPEGARFVDEP
jgi:hypothetical protein